MKLYKVTIFTKHTGEIQSNWIDVDHAIEAVAESLKAGEDRVQVESDEPWEE